MVVSVLMTLLITAGVLFYIYRVGNYGRILGFGIGVYDSETSTEQLESINWGSFGGIETKQRTVWCRNTQDIACTMEIFTTEWRPENVTDALIFTATYDKAQVLQPNQQMQVILYLTFNGTISETIDFSFTILFVATQYAEVNA